MANSPQPQEKYLQALSHRLIEMGRSAPPVQSYNRQLLRVLIDAVEADAATMWLVQQSELVMAEEIEQEGRAVGNIQISEQQQQQGLRESYEQGQSVTLRNSGDAKAGGRGYVVFVPVSDVQGVRGVVRLLVPAQSERELRRIVQLSEVICGYYSLYTSQRMLSMHQEERREIDRLSKSILEIQHYTFSHQLPDVLVNSALDIAGLDRVVLLSGGGNEDLEVEAVSSVVEKEQKSAWSKLVCDLGELVQSGGEPVHYFPGRDEEADIDDPELQDALNSYALMTDVKGVMLFPLESASEKAGVLIFEKFEDANLTSFESVLCTMFATHAASALGNHRIFDSMPLSGFYAKSIHKEEEEVKRGPFQFAPVAKVVAIIALIAGIGWFAGFHRVTEKVDADCFVAPFTTRIVTAEIDGEIGEVHFENGQIVEEGDVLIKFDTQDIDISLRRAQEEAEKIRAQISRLRGRAEDEENIDQRGQILAELRAKEHELNAEEEQINLLKDRLERATLRAPISGMMLEPEEPDEMRGVTASSGETLGRIGDVSEQVQVKVAIPGGRISEIETDYPVEIRLRPLVEERIVEGNIRHISSRSVTYEESNVFMAEVVVPRTVPAKGNSDRILTLQPGMTGKGKVLLPGETTYASIYARKLYRNVSYWLF